MDVLLPNKQAALRLVAECIADKDAAVRNAALNNLLCVWQLIGDKIFKDIGAVRIGGPYVFSSIARTESDVLFALICGPTPLCVMSESLLSGSSMKLGSSVLSSRLQDLEQCGVLTTRVRRQLGNSAVSGTLLLSAFIGPQLPGAIVAGKSRPRLSGVTRAIIGFPSPDVLFHAFHHVFLL